MDEVNANLQASSLWTGDVHVLKTPEPSEWYCYLFGSGDTRLGDRLQSVVYRPAKGCEPNAFWRWMQYVCFGNRWVRDK